MRHLAIIAIVVLVLGVAVGNLLAVIWNFWDILQFGRVTLIEPNQTLLIIELGGAVGMLVLTVAIAPLLIYRAGGGHR